MYLINELLPVWDLIKVFRFPVLYSMVSDCMFWNSNVRFRFQNSVPCCHFLDFRFQNWRWAEIWELVKLNWWLGAGSWELSWRTTARSPGRTELGPEWPELCIKSSKKNPLGERSWGKNLLGNPIITITGWPMSCVFWIMLPRRAQVISLHWNCACIEVYVSIDDCLR